LTGNIRVAQRAETYAEDCLLLGRVPFPSRRARARFSLWRDLYRARYGLLDIQFTEDMPFSAQFTFAQLASVGLGQFEGTGNRVERTRCEVAQAPSDDFCLVVNRGSSTMAFAHRGREAVLSPGAATLFNNAEPGALRGAAENAWFALIVPRDLLTLVADAEDLAGQPLARMQGRTRPRRTAPQTHCACAPAPGYHQHVEVHELTNRRGIQHRTLNDRWVGLR
jgi:hypothetical protein